VYFLVLLLFTTFLNIAETDLLLLFFEPSDDVEDFDSDSLLARRRPKLDSSSESSEAEDAPRSSSDLIISGRGSQSESESVSESLAVAVLNIGPDLALVNSSSSSQQSAMN